MDEKNSDARKLELEDIQRLGSSRYFLDLADSILSSLDRESLAELIAAFFYLKSKGKTDTQIANFLIARKTSKILQLTVSVLFAALPGMISDNEFRALILTLFERSIRNKLGSTSSRGQLNANHS